MIRKLLLRVNKPLERKMLSVAFFAALIILGWLIQGSIGLEQTLLNERYYLKLSEKLNIPAQLKTYLVNRFSEGREDIIVADSLFFQAINEAVSEDWIQQQIEVALTETLLFAKGQRQRLLLAVDLRESEELFRASLLEGLLKQAPARLSQLELTEELLREFVRQVDYPDRIVLVDLAFDALPAVYRRALDMFRFSRAATNLFIVLLAVALTVLGLVRVKGAGTLRLAGVALICSALSFKLFVAVARLWGTELLIQNMGGVEMAALFLGDASDVLPSAAAVAALEMGRISFYCGTAGLVLLAAHFAVKAGCRRPPRA